VLPTLTDRFAPDAFKGEEIAPYCKPIGVLTVSIGAASAWALAKGKPF